MLPLRPGRSAVQLPSVRHLARGSLSRIIGRNKMIGRSVLGEKVLANQIEAVQARSAGTPTPPSCAWHPQKSLPCCVSCFTQHGEKPF